MDPSDESIAVPPKNGNSSYEEAYNAFKTRGIENGYGFLLHRRRYRREYWLKIYRPWSRVWTTR